MSFQITTAFVEQFKSNIDTLTRQRGSQFRMAVVVDDEITGKRKATEQIGAGVARKRTSRHADTPLTPAEHRKRWYDLFDYEYADLIDQQDKVRMLIDPENAYALAGRDAMAHAMDDEIIAAATGTASAGEDGTTSVPLPAAQKVAVNYGGSNVGLTVLKLRRARTILRQGHVGTPAGGSSGEQLWCAVGAQQIDDLLGETQIGSSDYNAIKALVDGEVTRFMGFNFIHSERLGYDAVNDYRTVFCWATTGIELGIGMDIVTDIGVRRDKSLSTQVYVMMTIGAVRLQETKVVEITCDESP